MPYKNRKRNTSYKSLKIKDNDLIEYIESHGKKENKTASEVAEELLWNAFTGESKEMIKFESEIIIDKIGSGQIIDSLLNNGYTLNIQPIAGKTEMYGRLLITLESEN